MTIIDENERAVVKVPTIQLRTRIANAEALRGKMLTEQDVHVLVQRDADVYKPDGTPLLMLRRGSIPKPVLEHAYPALHELRKQKTDNRGAYAGATRTYAQFEDGTASKNSRTRTADGKRLLVASAVVGFYDRQGGRFPFCRQTAFAAKEVALWNTVVPMVEHVGNVFKQVAKPRYDAQMRECAKCPDYVISNTPFSTLTVNNNVAPSATHTDKGDFKGGLGVISVVRRGYYEGAWLVFPEYMVGVDLQDGDVLFFNSHDWHGVTPMFEQADGAERISVVYYLREKMVDCLPPADELARAQARGDMKEDGDEEA